MFDMLLLAFQTDSTRVATLLLAGEGSNRSFRRSGFRKATTTSPITETSRK